MKGTTVIYLDAKGLEHEALVFAVNPLNEGFISLVYVDNSKPEADNIVKQFDVRHMDMVEEKNADLPTYHLNCWKEDYRVSNALPSDHPAYDHPHRKNVDQDGNVIPVARPKYDAEVAAYNASSQADGYEPSSEGEPEPVPVTDETVKTDAPPAPPAPVAPPDAPAVQPPIVISETILEKAVEEVKEMVQKIEDKLS